MSLNGLKIAGTPVTKAHRPMVPPGLMETVALGFYGVGPGSALSTPSVSLIEIDFPSTSGAILLVSELLDHFSHSTRSIVALCALIVASSMSFGCASQAPTIAHVHIGHAITGHASTPDNAGFFQLAEEQANEAVTMVNKFDNNSSSAGTLHEKIDGLSYVLNYGSDHSFTESLREASNHLIFAADSDDASANIRTNTAGWTTSIEGVLARSDLIDLYIRESKTSSNDEETWQYAREIQKLVRANLSGEDLDQNGYIGNTLEEYGMRQLRRDLDAMIAAESPAYRTVDRWYLFNLIRLPSGTWMFRRSKSGQSQGY